MAHPAYGGLGGRQNENPGCLQSLLWMRTKTTLMGISHSWSEVTDSEMLSFLSGSPVLKYSMNNSSWFLDSAKSLECGFLFYTCFEFVCLFIPILWFRAGFHLLFSSPPLVSLCAHGLIHITIVSAMSCFCIWVLPPPCVYLHWWQSFSLFFSLF